MEKYNTAGMPQFHKPWRLCWSMIALIVSVEKITAPQYTRKTGQVQLLIGLIIINNLHHRARSTILQNKLRLTQNMQNIVAPPHQLFLRRIFATVRNPVISSSNVTSWSIEKKSHGTRHEQSAVSSDALTSSGLTYSLPSIVVQGTKLKFSKWKGFWRRL